MSQSIYDAPANPYKPAPLEDAQPSSTAEALVTRAADELSDPRIGEALRRTRPWTMMFGLILLLFSGLVSVIFFAALFATFMGNNVPARPQGMNIVAALLVGGIVLIYFCPAMHLMRYSSRIAKYLHSPTSTKLADALESQHKFWRYVGVMTVLGFIIQMCAIGAAILLPMAGR